MISLMMVTILVFKFLGSSMIFHVLNSACCLEVVISFLFKNPFKNGSEIVVQHCTRYGFLFHS